MTIDCLVVVKQMVADEGFDGLICPTGETLEVWQPQFWIHPIVDGLATSFTIDEEAGEITYSDGESSVVREWPPTAFAAYTWRLTRNHLVNGKLRLAVLTEVDTFEDLTKIVPIGRIGGYGFYHVRFATRPDAVIWHNWAKANINTHAGVLAIFDEGSEPRAFETTTVRDFIGEPAWTTRKAAARTLYSSEASTVELDAITNANTDPQFVLALMRPLAPDGWSTNQIQTAFWRRW